MGRFATSTRRALVFTLYSEGPLAAGALLFLLFPTRPVFLVTGIVLSMLLGFPAALAMWAGRREFGATAERGVKLTFLAFAFLAFSLLLAYFQVSYVLPETLRVTDLRAPWFFLGLALVADTTAMVALLSPLVVGPQRRWIHVTWAIGALVTVAFFWHGRMLVEDLIARSGGEAFVPAEATSYARDFVSTVVWEWTIAAMALRIGFWPALYAALSNVAEAERDAAAKVETPIVPPA